MSLRTTWSVEMVLTRGFVTWMSLDIASVSVPPFFGVPEALAPEAGLAWPAVLGEAAAWPGEPPPQAASARTNPIATEGMLAARLALMMLLFSSPDGASWRSVP